MKSVQQTIDDVRSKTVQIKGGLILVGQTVDVFEKTLYNNSGEIERMNGKCYSQIVASEKHLAAQTHNTNELMKSLITQMADSFEELKESTNLAQKQCKINENLERSGNLKLENDLENIVSFLEPVRRSCRDGVTRSGVYRIQLPGTSIFQAYCDMDTDGGGWLVFQRRKDGSVDFYKNWQEYKQGFGDVSGEFWLGNDLIHMLTLTSAQELRIDLWDWDGSTAYEKYGAFTIGPESDKYRLHVGRYSGTAGDGMSSGNNRDFSTKDRDNDLWPKSCAVNSQGAWWYMFCTNSNLNGHYYPRATVTTVANSGVFWYYWGGSHYSLKGSEMKIRPK